MIFTQHVNINNVAVNQELMNICKSHQGCKNCPLKTDDMELQGVLIRCETGRAKEGE